jgi:polyphenol oxidase
LIVHKNSKIIVAHSLKNDGNMALHTGDDAGSIVANRTAFLGKLGLDLKTLVCMDQTHSDRLEVVDSQNAGNGAFIHEGAVAATDALVTKAQGLTLAVMSADCVPVLLWDEDAGVVAAVHAGWKGTAKNIVSKTVAKMVEMGAKPQAINAFINASIGECCYEVGEDVASTCGCAGQNRVDLKKQNRLQLLDSGLSVQNISESAHCTSCDNDSYFSHRKEQGCAGRFMSVISILPASVAKR